MITHQQQLYNQRKAELEARMIEVVRDARDGAGLPVKLEPSVAPTADSLRESLRDLLEQRIGQVVFVPCVFVCPAGEAAGEAAYWDNVALIARATAAALRFEAAGE